MQGRDEANQNCRLDFLDSTPSNCVEGRVLSLAVTLVESEDTRQATTTLEISNLVSFGSILVQFYSIITVIWIVHNPEKVPENTSTLGEGSGQVEA